MVIAYEANRVCLDNINKQITPQLGDSAAKLRAKVASFGFKVSFMVWGGNFVVSISDYFQSRIIKSKNMFML